MFLIVRKLGRIPAHRASKPIDGATVHQLHDPPAFIESACAYSLPKRTLLQDWGIGIAIRTTPQKDWLISRTSRGIGLSGVDLVDLLDIRIPCKGREFGRLPDVVRLQRLVGLGEEIHPRVDSGGGESFHRASRESLHGVIAVRLYEFRPVKEQPGPRGLHP
jgi:hypothetical protein